MTVTAIQRLLIGSVLLGASLYGVSGCKARKAPEVKESAYGVDKKVERGPLTVHVRLDHDKITIAQTLRLELEAQSQPGYKVTMPKIDKALEGFGLADWDSPGDRLGEKNTLIKTYRYRLEPMVSGKYQIPALTFHFQDANDPNKAYTLDTEPIDVEVTSLLGDDRAKLTIADIEGVVGVPRPRSYAVVAAIVALGLGGLGLGIGMALRRRRAVQTRRLFKPAHEVAYDRLRALVRQGLVEAGRVKEFYQAVSDILRHYIEDRFSLKAPEQTTEEFLVTLSQSNDLPAPDKAALGEFLRHCDLVKFARHQPTAEQIQQTFDLVKAFIEKTRSQQHVLDVTDQTPAEAVVEGVTP